MRFTIIDTTDNVIEMQVERMYGNYNNCNIVVDLNQYGDLIKDFTMEQKNKLATDNAKPKAQAVFEKIEPMYNEPDIYVNFEVELYTLPEGKKSSEQAQAPTREEINRINDNLVDMEFKMMMLIDQIKTLKTKLEEKGILDKPTEGDGGDMPVDIFPLDENIEGEEEL